MKLYIEQRALLEEIMYEKCERPIFGRGTSVLGYCALLKGHDGYPENCMLQSETKSETERESTRQLDIDLNEAWKPIRDVPGSDEILPEHLIPDED